MSVSVSLKERPRISVFLLLATCIVCISPESSPDVNIHCYYFMAHPPYRAPNSSFRPMCVPSEHLMRQKARILAMTVSERRVRSVLWIRPVARQGRPGNYRHPRIGCLGPDGRAGSSNGLWLTLSKERGLLTTPRASDACRRFRVLRGAPPMYVVWCPSGSSA